MFPEPRQQALDSLDVEESELRAITQPALVLHGRDDVVIPVSNAYRLLELLDDAELHVFGRCGHWVQIDAFPPAGRGLPRRLVGAGQMAQEDTKPKEGS